ncbi:MAG: hypothetical protein ISS19_16825, partial [Bacteroidales bacterium]|nr:hypothetical protein [Bacteroidales bacterium]
MKFKLIIPLFFLAIMGCQTSVIPVRELKLGTFGAFYTKINSGEEFEKYSRTGDYADIVIDLGKDKGKFVFWRGSSYLPYLETANGKWFVEEVIPRKGDGEGQMPDRINTHSWVKIIESNSEKVVVHWRYLPEFGGINPHTGVDATKFVDEYFTIKSDLTVQRTIRQGTQRIDGWKDPGNKTVQSFTLTSEGITDVSTKEPKLSDLVKPVEGSPEISRTVTDPVLWFRFNEAKGNETTESVSGEVVEIAGHKSLWKKGISGTALQFDGYNTVIQLTTENAPAITDGITLEAWITIGAYPWNWTPVVQQGDDEGYFLGIDAHGHPGINIMVGDVWEELASEAFLERNTWYHLAGTYDMGTGKMAI